MSIWTPQFVETLRDLTRRGLSASDVSQELRQRYGFDVTRNAVIGKLNRLGAGNGRIGGRRVRWDDERTNLLRELADKGLSPTDIRAELAARGIDTTRNAVIGKLHAIGVPTGRKTAKPAAAFPRAPRAAMRPEKLPPTPRVPDLPEPPLDLRIPLLAASIDACRFAYGEPREASFVVCGAPSIEGTSWCAYHTRIVYQRPDRRPRKRHRVSVFAVRMLT